MTAKPRQRSSPARLCFVAVLGLVALAVASCGNDRSGFDKTSRVFPDTLDAAQPEQRDAGCDGLYCSRDLKSVLRGCSSRGGADELVETCGPGKGCGDGSCVSACRAAAISKGSIGCEFYAVQPNDYEGSCYAALIANSWDEPADLSAELGGEAIDISRSIYDVQTDAEGNAAYTQIEGPLAPGKVGVVFLSHMTGAHVTCPDAVVPARVGSVAARGTGFARAFRISSSVPVSSYAIFPYGGAKGYYPAASLLLPISSYDKGYIAVSPSRVGARPGDGTGGTRTLVGDRYVQIVASEDNTTVSVLPRVDVADGEGVVGTAAGHVKSWTLSRGQLLQFVQASDLTGSLLSADKPIGLFGGARCSYVPSSWQACDLMQQQIPPPAQWGHEYAVAPFRPRWSSDPKDDVQRARDVAPYSIVAAVDGTVLTYDPGPPASAPRTLSAGESVSFSTDAVFTVRSQDAAHPFFVGSFMPSAQYPNGATNSNGDPEFVNVVPTDQYLDRYVFFTDHTYANTSLTVIRRRTENGFLPVTLECAGEVSGFQPIGTGGEYEYAWVLMTANFVSQKFGDKVCGYGHQKIFSEGPFEVTVWGTDYYASYGFPGGMGLRPISPVKPEVEVVR